MRRRNLGPIGWHVFARGARRMDLYRDEQDYEQFLIFLKFALRKSGCRLWAFVLMSNHYHFVLYGSSEQLTACMRRLNGLYSKYHNRRYGLSGHAFDGPYHAYPQPSRLLLLRTVAYVLMNPVAAGMTRAPENYRWSAIGSYFGLPTTVLDIDPSSLMAEVHVDANAAWDLFHRAMDREARRPKFRNPGALTRLQVHVQQFEWLLDHARERRDAFGGEHPDLVAMHWAQHYGICPKAMARVLEIDNPVWISQTLYKFRKRLAQNPQLADLVSAP